MKDDTEVPAVREGNAFAQPARTTETVQLAGDGAGILAEFSGLALKTVNLLDDLDRKEDIVLLELEQRIRVMEQDIGVKDVVLFHEQRL
jgi:hypothetical protein